MDQPRVVILIPESTRKERGGDPGTDGADSLLDTLSPAGREKLGSLRQQVRTGSPANAIARERLLPAYRRFQGNMYRHIPRDVWENRAAGVEVVIVSGLLGLVASRDRVPWYEHSMAEAMPPFGKLNRWWHRQGLPGLLGDYLHEVAPETVVDLLSLEYREAVAGFADSRAGITVKTIDFPGQGRASQPKRGERVAQILRSGKV